MHLLPNRPGKRPCDADDYAQNRCPYNAKSTLRRHENKSQAGESKPEQKKKKRKKGETNKNSTNILDEDMGELKPYPRRLPHPPPVIPWHL